MIRVILTNDHPLINAAIHHLFFHEPDIELVGTVSSFDEVIRHCYDSQPDILLISYSFNNILIHLSENVKENFDHAKILVFSGEDDQSFICGLIEAGISGYLLKDEPFDAFVQAIRAVAVNGQWFSKGVLEKIRLSGPKDGKNRSCLRLTDLQIEIIRLLAEGNTNKQIACKLALQERIVRYHVERILDKLGAKNRAEAVHIGLQQGWVKKTERKLER